MTSMQIADCGLRCGLQSFSCACGLTRHSLYHPDRYRCWQMATHTERSSDRQQSASRHGLLLSSKYESAIGSPVATMSTCKTTRARLNVVKTKDGSSKPSKTGVTQSRDTKTRTEA